MARHSVGFSLATVALAFGVSSGCGEAIPPTQAVTGLHLTTTAAFSANPPPINVDVTLTDPLRSGAIYTMTLALPKVADGHQNCPSDSGVRHPVDFTDAQSRVLLTAVVNPEGCGEVKIARSFDRQTNRAYWTSLAQTLGIEEATLFALAEP
jgi:hypothetical protein